MSDIALTVSMLALAAVIGLTDGTGSAVRRRAGHRRRCSAVSWSGTCPERANQPERGHAALYPGVWPDPRSFTPSASRSVRFLLCASLVCASNAFAVLLVLTGGVVAAVPCFVRLPLPIILGVFSGAVGQHPGAGLR